jgi:hypothetical protein
MVDETEPLSGRVAGEGSPPVEFSGWLPLLRILAQLTTSGDLAAEGLGGELAPGGPPDLAKDV